MNADFAILGLSDLGGWTLAQATGGPALPPIPSPNPSVTPAPTGQTTVGEGNATLDARPSFLSDPLGNIAGWFAARWQEFLPWLRRSGVNLALVVGGVGLVFLFVASGSNGAAVVQSVKARVLPGAKGV